jgi:hypothetical protein
LVFFLSESPIICPQNFSKKNFENPTNVFSWSERLVESEKCHRYYLPFGVGERDSASGNINFENQKLLMDVSGNKFSKIPGELYSFRRKSIEYFEKYYPKDFDLYGVGWGEHGIWWHLKNLVRYMQTDFHHYSSYEGFIDNKSRVMSGYKFVLCYENFRYEDYISNRIFDVFVNNSVPVYYGCPNISKYIPEDAFINRGDFESDEELSSYLLGIDENRHQKYLDNIDDFLNSKQFKLFLSDNFVNTVVSALRC